MKRGEHLHELNRRRALTVRTLAKSEKALTDSERIRQEQEAKRAASMWVKGYDAEERK